MWIHPQTMDLNGMEFTEVIKEQIHKQNTLNKTFFLDNQCLGSDSQGKTPAIETLLSLDSKAEHV